MENKKGQLSLGNAPTIVLIVGLTFLVMATVAFIGEKYQASMPSSLSTTTYEEVVTQAQLATGTYPLSNISLCNAGEFTVLAARNGTDGPEMTSGNYTINAATGVIANLTNTMSANWLVNYTVSYSGEACNINRDLQTNISGNTSIAGIVLTISLVGIILTILIGVFLGVRKAGSRV